MKMNVISALSLVSIILTSGVSFASKSTAREMIVNLACQNITSTDMEALCAEAGALDQDRIKIKNKLIQKFHKAHSENKNMKSYSQHGSMETEIVCGDLDVNNQMECAVMSSAGDDGGKYYVTTKVSVVKTGSGGKFEITQSETKEFAAD